MELLARAFPRFASAVGVVWAIGWLFDFAEDIQEITAGNPVLTVLAIALYLGLTHYVWDLDRESKRAIFETERKGRITRPGRRR